VSDAVVVRDPQTQRLAVAPVSATPAVVLREDPRPTVVLTGFAGAAGRNGTGGDLSATFVQGAASQVWSINHNLGKYPSVAVTDSAGNQGFGSVRYIDANSLTVSFAAPFAGVAYLN
jgi:hypothetical protein